MKFREYSQGVSFTVSKQDIYRYSYGKKKWVPFWLWCLISEQRPDLMIAERLEQSNKRFLAKLSDAVRG
jgi:hypothetical protein